MYFNFSITNLFSKHNVWKKHISLHKQISENKHLEFETFYSNNYLFQIEFKFLPYGEDHAGANLMLNLVGWEFEARFYDSRHWDYKNWCWEE
jgi:hypothetical protein